MAVPSIPAQFWLTTVKQVGAAQAVGQPLLPPPLFKVTCIGPRPPAVPLQLQPPGSQVYLAMVTMKLASSSMIPMPAVVGHPIPSIVPILTVRVQNYVITSTLMKAISAPSRGHTTGRTPAHNGLAWERT